MNDDLVRDLVRDAAEGIEPGDRLDAIRAATAPAGRRTSRGWWVAGGAGLIAASVVTALFLGGGADPRGSDPGPATTSPSPTSPSPSPTTSATGTPERAVAVYYVGNTPDGPRLYREFRRVHETDPLAGALIAAIHEPPHDSDYRSVWPQVGRLISAAVVGDVIRIELDESATLPHGLPEAERMAAIEQLIYTAQAAVQERLPVQFVVNGNPSAEILGLPTSEPLAAGDLLSTLAHVSISDPSEGLLVDNDEPFIVKGVGNSFEGNIVTRIQRWEGTYVVDEEPAIAGWGPDKLFPFEITFDLTDVPPGDYLVVSRTDDPSGEGRFHSDSRRITIVD